MSSAGRILTVSDIHGYGGLLEKLLERADYRPGHDRLFLLGDYVNKGPDSEGTLALIESLCKGGAVALTGNNELRWLNNNVAPRWSPFLRTLPLWCKYEGYLFVHAGIRPGVPLEQ
ncbi:metallophosphoesterase [Paenibacillus sp. NPDC057934]|uniref:metallophosphoesterase n=1 Tax=Paenibacillus sp. NPDC057934 TaxID=3346282 RepID=UPI0036DF203F